MPAQSHPGQRYQLRAHGHSDGGTYHAGANVHFRTNIAPNIASAAVGGAVTTTVGIGNDTTSASTNECTKPKSAPVHRLRVERLGEAQ